MGTTLRTVPRFCSLSEIGRYPSPMRMNRGLTTALLATAGVATLSSCSSSNISGLGYEKGLSSVNDVSLPLWQGVWITAGIVGVVTAILILWPAVFHRKKNDEFPKQTRYNVPTEVAYTVIPFIIVAVLFAYTARDESRITKVTPAAQAKHSITVNSIQWSWQFTYDDAHAGNKGTITGTPAHPPTLVLPQGEKVRFTLTSTDVVHGFWIPAFMIQMQNLPNVTNHLEFSANKLGTYPGRCNILCGRNHSQMLFTVKVVTPAQYQDYLNTLKAA